MHFSIYKYVNPIADTRIRLHSSVDVLLGLRRPSQFRKHNCTWPNVAKLSKAYCQGWWVSVVLICFPAVCKGQLRCGIQSNPQPRLCLWSETRTPGQEPHSLCCGLSWQWTPLPPTENISHVRLMSAFPPLLIFSVWDVLDKFQDMIHHDCLLIAAEPQPSSCHLWEGSPGNSRLWHTKLPVLARAPHDGCTQLAGAWAVAAGG